MVKKIDPECELPKTLGNWLNGKSMTPVKKANFEKVSPVTGEILFKVARSSFEDVDAMVQAARNSQPEWADTSPVRRGEILYGVVRGMRENQDLIAHTVAMETGKSYSAALGETDGAIALGNFMAGEGQRLYGRTTTSGTPNRYAMTVRQPVGVAALFVAFNTPIANIAWKAFPALICGNTAVVKASEDTPATAWLFAKLASEYGLPPGVLNVVQGLGPEAGADLVNHPGIDLISFTGSTAVGRQIAEIGARRLLKVSLELGGKNPLVVCNDADLENAAKWVLLSVFSNSGQRCASASRIIVFDSIYKIFTEILVQKTLALKLGPEDSDDLGPVINLQQLNNMLNSIEKAKRQGARILCGGQRMMEPPYDKGFYMQPTLIEGISMEADISRTELFGPVACLYRAKDWAEALAMSNDSPYGLTASIHTRDVNRAALFAAKVQTGVVTVNGGTYGSEPHMPFGGVKNSGNGLREPGTEALDVYTELKDIYININPGAV